MGADLNLCMYLNRVTVEGTIQDMASRQTAKGVLYLTTLRIS